MQNFIANEYNTIFVNFYKAEYHDKEPFGKKELFKKKYDTFTKFEDYKNSLKNLTEENIEKNALKLRAEVKEKLLNNKFLGWAVGSIPFAEWALKNLIKKMQLKKVGEIFGIDVKFIDNENAKNEKKLKIK